jgi:hypothetical protein
MPKHLIGCWITRQWSNGLSIENRPSRTIPGADKSHVPHVGSAVVWGGTVPTAGSLHLMT